MSEAIDMVPRARFQKETLINRSIAKIWLGSPRNERIARGALCLSNCEPGSGDTHTLSSQNALDVVLASITAGVGIERRIGSSAQSFKRPMVYVARRALGRSGGAGYSGHSASSSWVARWEGDFGEQEAAHARATIRRVGRPAERS